MTNAVKTGWHWLCVLALLWMGAAQAAEGVNGRLVSAAWLEQNVKRADLVLLDASPTPAYLAEHIPGAVGADFYAYGGVREPSAAQVERRLQGWGIGPGKTVVVYDPGGSHLATRVFFDLLHHGVPAQDLFVLDGGLAKWKADGRALTKDPTPPPAPGSFRATTPREDVRARLNEFLLASGDPKRNALVEALGPSWHYGETAFFDRGGHVPHALMWPESDFFNADKTFKSTAEIRRMAEHLGIRREQQVYTYCGGGVAAALPFFALKFLLDYPQVKLYQESQLEWLQDERGLPFWTYSAPYLMRETPWLKAWGGRMMRMFGQPRISVVDVRAAEVHRQGHLPFALNLPAEAIRERLDQPAELAQWFGQSGIDPAHEAVIVSEGGLTEAAALAFVALENLGQRRTAIFMPSTERWAEQGQEVTREPTAVGPRKSPMDLSIPLANYPAPAAPAALLRDLKAGPAPIYPRLFLASGRNLPARAVDGPVVHLPYTVLLDADGQPKPAKDLWNQLAKAGVSRYAQIVCYADSVGEAAVNYYLLKLMGFPDVKVWVP